MVGGGVGSVIFLQTSFLFFLHVCMHSRTRLCGGVTVEKICQIVRAELSRAEMITMRRDPEKNTLFMLLANIAQSELANQNRRICSNCQQYGCGHREKTHAVSLSSMRFLPRFCRN